MRVNFIWFLTIRLNLKMDIHQYRVEINLNNTLQSPVTRITVLLS